MPKFLEKLSDADFIAVWVYCVCLVAAMAFLVVSL